MDDGPQLDGMSGKYISYDFEREHDDTDETIELKKKIGYADIDGITSFSCNNCVYFKHSSSKGETFDKDGDCEKWDLRVESDACCSSWDRHKNISDEERARLFKPKTLEEQNQSSADIIAKHVEEHKQPTDTSDDDVIDI